MSRSLRSRALCSVLRTSVAVLVGTALLAQGQTVNAFPASAENRPAEQVPRAAPGTGSDYKVIPREPDLDVDLVARPSVVWPAAGSAEVVLPEVSWTARLSGVLPKQAAGVLPVALGPAAADGTAPAGVKVDLLGRRGSSLVVKLTSKDKTKAAGKVSLELNYQAFRYAYGGDWATRLQLVELPACAEKAPVPAGCRGKPVTTRNAGSGKLSADVPATGLYAMEAAAEGPAGDFGASSLAPSASWSVGGSSGDFNWQYPIRTPPGTGGPTAQVSIGYSSGSVDGRTSGTNNQTSWVGEGFELAPGGSIERRYASCASESEKKTGNNGTRAVADLCYATDNATFTLNGKGGELVLDDATGQWRPKIDDGSKVEKRSGTTNGDEGRTTQDQGEYWVITGKDGTKFYFGLNKIPSPNAKDTNSTWTVPVAGNHAGEPCHATAFANSFCQQAYKWNLDYVVDVHGNTMSLFYETERNHYAFNGAETTTKSYDRAGHVKWIEYGQSAGQVFSEKAVARVHFDTTERCVTGTSCVKEDFFDTPTDQECGSARCNQFAPSFFTKKKLSRIRTEVWRGSAFDPVDTWTLRHSFPNPGDNTSPRLWLEGITHTGEVGTGAVSTPEVNFDKIQKSNRVPDGRPAPLLDWFRISAIHYGTGGRLAVSYSGADCKSAPDDVPPADRNHRLCHPMKWTPPGATAEREDWFHKYVVTSVTESDRVSGMVPVVTTVTYPGRPAWRHDDEDGLVEIGRKTWSQWRGFDRVVVTKGGPGGPQTVTENRYFQGMDGDKLKGTEEVKNEHVEDSAGGSFDDLNAWAGQERESSKLVGGVIVERTITDPGISKPTSTRQRDWGTTQAFKVEQKAVRQWTARSGGGFQQTAASNEYDPDTFVLTASTDAGDLATTADDTCTRYEYANNAALGLAELPTRTQVVAKACNQPSTKDDVISDQLLAYPGGTLPQSNQPVQQRRLASFSTAGEPVYETVLTTGYDDHGRKKTESDAKNQVTTYSYSPADGPVAETSVRAPNGHTSTTVLDPAWGQSVQVTDVGGRTTVSERDPMGRISKVWLPGRARTETPNVAHTYLAGIDKPNVVRTETLQSDGTVETSYEILDGLQRKRQTQKPATDGIGRIITDIEYDSRGLAVIRNNPYHRDQPPSDQPYDPDESTLRGRRVTQYDGLERPVREGFWSNNQEKWFTIHKHEPDRQTVDPPTGEQATTRILDAQGRLVELRAYNTPSESTNFDKTTYTYTKAGQLEKVTDPAGNVWRYEYDLRGRKKLAQEPDRGVTTFDYNELDQLISTTDARGKRLFFSYDEIGRQKTVREDRPDGPLRVERTYDTPTKGSPSSATRYVNGQPYKTEVTGYHPSGTPVGTRITLPAVEGALAKTYEFSQTYTPTGQPHKVTLPGIGGLPAETLTTTYDTNELPVALSSAEDTYVTDAKFDPLGELTNLRTQQQDGPALDHTYIYDQTTRRLARTYVQREAGSPSRVLDQSYTYDDAGNVTKIVDAPASGSAEPTDVQCFNYDESRRLTQAWTPGDGNCATQPASASQLGGPAPYWHQWTFDAIGNRKTEKRTTTAGATTSRYDYPAAGQARPHAVQKVTTTGPDGTTKVNEYGYDDAGNQTSRKIAGVGETFDFDVEGRLAKVTKGDKKTEYIYDADGNRLLRKDHTGTTLYLGDTELLLMPDGSELGTRHYKFGKQTIAVRVGSKLSWLGSDHHGSATLTVDAKTQAYQRKRITPYGETRGAVPTAWPGQRDFVGGTRDDSTGLVHLGAREYDPTTGRFISVDPVVDPEDPQQLNAYAYANNSPASFVDADGMRYRMETVTELKKVVRHHVKRIKELKKEVFTITVSIFTNLILAITYAALGMFDKVRALTQEIVKQVTRWKEIWRTIRWHTVEIKRIVTTKFIKAAGRDAAEMRQALNLAKQTGNTAKAMEAAAGNLEAVARKVSEWAVAAQAAAEANKQQNADQQCPRCEREKAAERLADTSRDNAKDEEMFGRDTYTDTGMVVGGAVGTLGGIPGTILGGFLGYWAGRFGHAQDVAAPQRNPYQDHKDFCKLDPYICRYTSPSEMPRRR